MTIREYINKILNGEYDIDLAYDFFDLIDTDYDNCRNDQQVWSYAKKLAKQFSEQLADGRVF